MTNTWIDGLGGSDGILHNYNEWVGMDGYLLLCFSEHDTVKYADSVYNTCYLATGIRDHSHTRNLVNIFPDPVTDVSLFKISASPCKKNIFVVFYNNTGRKIFTKTGNTEFCITREDYHAGLIFIASTTAHGQ